MSDACYCDYDGEQADVQHSERRCARKAYRCYECSRGIAPRETYERTATLYDGSWDLTRVCCRCLDARDYITAHAPCFCWSYGSMLDDAKDTLNEYGRHSAGFYIGGMKRVLRAERHKPHNAELTGAPLGAPGARRPVARPVE